MASVRCFGVQCLRLVLVLSVRGRARVCEWGYDPDLV